MNRLYILSSVGIGIIISVKEREFECVEAHYLLICFLNENGKTWLVLGILFKKLLKNEYCYI